MALDLEEQEQLDEFKEWWKKNGFFVLAVVTTVVVAIAGWKGWQGWTAKQASEAAALFEQAMQAAVGNNAKAVRDLTTQIMDDYGRTAYAAPAAWLAGRASYIGGDLKSAQVQYKYAADHAGDDGLEQLGRLRLATVLLDQNDPAGALRELGGNPDPAFAPLYANLRGDALVSQGKTAEARAAYTQALEKLDAKSSLRALVEMKLDGLGS